jgi:allantoicase
MISAERPFFDEVRGELVIEPEDEFASHFVNLADPRLGARALAATDEFFAAKERMLDPIPPVFVPGKYDDHGKWMDGWETRRRREPGHEHCIIRLAFPGEIKGVVIDTTHFTGNFAPAASLDACRSEGDPGSDAEWIEIVPPTTLEGDGKRAIAVESAGRWTHVRVHLYPDGGIARLRIYGEVRWDWSLAGGEAIDVAAIENGGRVVACSDQHYSLPSNILRPGVGLTMADGWETHRRREPGHEWAIIALGHKARITGVEVNTATFKGNYPDRCAILGALIDKATDASLVPESMFWPVLLPEEKLAAHRSHLFETQVIDIGPVTHVRFCMIPDGGVMRVRLFGHPVD